MANLSTIQPISSQQNERHLTSVDLRHLSHECTIVEDENFNFNEFDYAPPSELSPGGVQLLRQNLETEDKYFPCHGSTQIGRAHV